MKRAEAKRLAKFCMLDENDENVLKQIAMGTKDEAEHAIADTVEKRAAIAAEHIREDPHYYTKLRGAGLMKARFTLRKSEDRANHKYIKKVGDHYFYTQDEIDKFSLTKKSDGYYYMDETKVTNDPEKAKAFEAKIKGGKDVHTPSLKVGQKVQIKASQSGSLGRGVVGKIKELGKDFARVVNEAGDIFRVPTSALAYAKSRQEGGVMVLVKAKKPKSGKAKIAYVMKEFAAGRLKGSDGKVVTDKKQALAIAYSEAGMKSIRERKDAILLKSRPPEPTQSRLALGIHPTVESCHVHQATDLQALREGK